MITRIEVSGFKSLVDFKLDLKPGLNILVGHNGAGKTNIVQFFEFLANLMDRHVAKGIIASGGVGSVFQKIGTDRFVDEIKCRVCGSVPIDSTKAIDYEHSFKIHRSTGVDAIHYSEQRLMIRVLSGIGVRKVNKISKGEWDFEVEFEFKGDNSPPIIKVRPLENDRLETLLTEESSRVNDLKLELLKGFLISQNLGYYSIVSALSSYANNNNLFWINYDLVSGKAFNIVPDKVREPEDSANPSGINKDGSGLAATLYAIKKKRDKQSSEHCDHLAVWEKRADYLGADVMNQAVKYLQAANSTVESLDVENDSFSNKLIVKITIQSGDYSAVLPLSAMSDGTIKWLTLITAILTSKTMFSIEEPENYLHPWMQAEIVRIMREHLEEKRETSFALMTTHSETLINYAKPEEIILVSLSDGKTMAKRMPVSKQKLVKKEIANTGFGLGFFYFANALSDD